MTVQTNATTLYFAEETSPGVVSAGAVWKAEEPNDITSVAASITKGTRNPISPDRMAKKGATLDLDSAVEFAGDLTISAFENYGEAFLRALAETQLDFSPTSVTATGYTVAADGDLTENQLVYARDFGNPTNNGLKVVGTLSTTTEVKVSGLAAEASPPLGARLQVCGIQGEAGDITMDSSGDLNSTLLDFSTLGLSSGQSIYIGGGTAATSLPIAGDGTARVRTITATKLVLDNHSDKITIGTDVAATETIQIFLGDRVKNVPLNHSDYLSRTYQFEVGFSGLDAIDKGWIYSIGNSANNISISFTTGEFAAATYSFIGQNTEDLTDTIKTGDHIATYLTDALSATANVADLKLRSSDGADLTTYFKNVELTINNNISAEKVVEHLGGIATNIGDLEVTMSSSVVLSAGAILDAAKNNTTLSMAFLLYNDDGGMMFDIPSLTLDDSSFSLPRGESVLIDTGGNGFKDDFFGYVISITKFPYLPKIN